MSGVQLTHTQIQTNNAEAYSSLTVVNRPSAHTNTDKQCRSLFPPNGSHSPFCTEKAMLMFQSFSAAQYSTSLLRLLTCYRRGELQARAVRA